MTTLELMKALERAAVDYRTDWMMSLIRNRHLVTCEVLPDADQVDAVLVDFINFIGMRNGVDYALATNDWKAKARS